MWELWGGVRAAAAILAVLAIESILLVRGGRPLVDVASMLLPAALIVVALRAALVGADWPWIALPLALSFPVHLWDLSRRPPRR